MASLSLHQKAGKKRAKMSESWFCSLCGAVLRKTHKKMILVLALTMGLLAGISDAQSYEKGCGYVKSIDSENEKIVVEEASFSRGPLFRNNPKTGKILEFYIGDALIYDASNRRTLQINDLKPGDKIGYHYEGNTIMWIERVPNDWGIMEAPHVEGEDGPTTMIGVSTSLCGPCERNTVMI